MPTDCYHEVGCECGSKWCFTCGEEDHRPATCEHVKAWADKASDADLSAMYIKANTKKCPKCALEIIKDEGCAHMKCTQCAHHFCWLCLGPYAQHNEKTGGFYACNKVRLAPPPLSRAVRRPSRSHSSHAPLTAVCAPSLVFLYSTV